MLAGRPLELLTRYALPLAIALAVYATASRIPGVRAPPEEDVRTAPLREDELLGHEPAPVIVPPLEPRVPEPPPAGGSTELRR